MTRPFEVVRKVGSVKFLKPDSELEDDKPEDVFRELLTNRDGRAFDYLMQNPKVLDTLPIYELRLVYHQYFKGFIPEERLSGIFKMLEARVKSTEL